MYCVMCGVNGLCIYMYVCILYTLHVCIIKVSSYVTNMIVVRFVHVHVHTMYMYVISHVFNTLVHA